MSRRALVDQLQGEPQRDVRTPRAGKARGSLLDGIAWAPMARKVASHWWRRHPLNTAGQLARPLLERFARERPLTLVAGAAAIGAAVVLARPWRLLGASTLALTLLKTSDAAGLVNSLMQRKPSKRKDHR